MIWFRMIFLFILASFLCLGTNLLLAEENNEDTTIDEEIFQSLDRDDDGKICREEWDAIDKDRDNTICKDEWKRWEFKSEPKKKSTWFDLKWYDNDGDGFMNQEEFYRYPRPRL